MANASHYFLKIEFKRSKVNQIDEVCDMLLWFKVTQV